MRYCLSGFFFGHDFKYPIRFSLSFWCPIRFSLSLCLGTFNVELSASHDKLKRIGHQNDKLKRIGHLINAASASDRLSF